MNVYGVVAGLEGDTVMMIAEPCDKDPQGSYLVLTGPSRLRVSGLFTGDEVTLTIVAGPYVSKRVGSAMTGDSIHWTMTR